MYIYTNNVTYICLVYITIFGVHVGSAHCLYLYKLLGTPEYRFGQTLILVYN